VDGASGCGWCASLRAYKLALTSADELRIVIGLGLTVLRTAALECIAYATGVRLFIRTKTRRRGGVTTVAGYGAPAITRQNQLQMTFLRLLEIVGGSVLIIAGVIFSIPLVPLPGIPLIVAGVLLVSPYHGRRLAWWFVIAWKWVNQKWHEYYHNRKAHPRSRKGIRKRKLWPFWTTEEDGESEHKNTPK
jgi:hypothetical protein